MYAGKNITRNETINKIELTYIADTSQINRQFHQDLISAEIEYNYKEHAKVENRNYWYKSIGIGILVIILISNILVIFNMQRTLRKIDDKLDNTNVKV